jgi:hypothetical protein
MAMRLDREGSTRAMLIGLVVRVAIGSAITWALYFMQGPLGLVFAAPAWGALLAKPILDLVPAVVGGLRSSAFPYREGDVHTFETHHLRVCSVGGYPWIVDSDLLAALGEKPSETQRRRADAAFHAEIPETNLWGFSESGAIKLLKARRHPDALRLQLFLERQVFLPARKRRERAG